MRHSSCFAAVIAVAMLGSSMGAANAGGHRGGGAPMIRTGGFGHPAMAGGGFHDARQGWGGAGRGGYHALPPVEGTLRPGPHGMYGDRSFGRVQYGTSHGSFEHRGGYGYRTASAGFGYHSGGPGIYDVHRGRRFGHRFHGGADGVYGGGYGGGYGYGYGDTGADYGTYAEGTPTYAGQGFAPVAGAGYGPVTYQQTAGYGYGYGNAGGLGVYVPGAYGPGPSIISIPDHYNVGHCGCGGGGLLQSLN